MREPFPRQHIAQAMDGFSVAVKVRKAHRNFVAPSGSPITSESSFNYSAD
jgi:hypothetical protein